SICFGSEVLPVELSFVTVNIGILKTMLMGEWMHASTHLVNYVLWSPVKSLKFLSKLLLARKKNRIRTATIREIAEALLHERKN
ncbi:MAG: hypothetical protein DRJ69_03850, partial [Thermoprotei archaeon]